MDADLIVHASKMIKPVFGFFVTGHDFRQQFYLNIVLPYVLFLGVYFSVVDASLNQ